MKGATVGGAVPAILFNTPGTPDAMLTTFDGYPMAKKGQAGKALKTAHFASVSGDTFSDLVLFTCAPFLAIIVEAYLGFGEKAALILLSLAFVAAVVGASPMKGMIAAFLGLFIAAIGTGEDTYSRLSFGTDFLSNGVPLITAVLGVLILGEVLFAFEQMWRDRQSDQPPVEVPQSRDNKLTWKDRRKLMPFISVSAVIGTGIGALPGIGSTLAATLGMRRASGCTRARYPLAKARPRASPPPKLRKFGFGREPDPGFIAGYSRKCGGCILDSGRRKHWWVQSRAKRFPVHNLGGEPGTGHCLWPLHHDDAGQHHELDHRWSIHAYGGRHGLYPETSFVADCSAADHDRDLCAGNGFQRFLLCLCFCNSRLPDAQTEDTNPAFRHRVHSRGQFGNGIPSSICCG